MDGFIILDKIGEGSYSKVLKVKRKEDGNIYALKRVKFFKLSDKEKQNALNEIRLLASIKDKNVISYKEAFFDENDSSLGVVMEYADKGDLFHEIAERKKTKNYFNEEEIWKVFIQLLKGLKSLHDLNILHRDIKSANVFLFDGGICKLGDLNVSKIAKKGIGYTQTGTPYYASPEVWDEKPYDSKSDVWSLGCVIYEMITFRPPFQAKSMDELYKRIMRGIYPKIPSRYSEDLSDIIKLMIQVEVGARPNCEELLKMPIITKRIDYFNENKELDIAEEQNNSINKLVLLKTINVPNKMENLSKNLPKPNYNTKPINRSFENNNKNHQNVSLTISNVSRLPKLNRKLVLNKIKLKNNEISTNDDSDQIDQNRSNQSIKSEPKKYMAEERKKPQYLPKKRKNEHNNSNDNAKNDIFLPNLYSNNNRSKINNRSVNKNNNDSNKLIIREKNMKSVKLLDGRNINGNNKNNKNIPYSNNIAVIRQLYLLNDEYSKNSGNKQINSKLINNMNSIGANDRNYLKLLQQRKKRMLFIGKK